MLTPGMAMRDADKLGSGALDSASAAEHSTLESNRGTPTPERRGFALTVLHHPDGRRVGESTAIGSLVGGVPTEVSRVTPKFRPSAEANGRPLEHRRLSRSPVWIRLSRDTVSITPSRSELDVSVEGKAIANGCEVALDDVRERGLVMALGRGRVLLCLHEVQPERVRLAGEELLGPSPAVGALSDAIARVAPLTGPVFLRGERGSGQERVAREIHRLGERAAGPYRALDLQATPGPLVAGELFDVEDGWLVRTHGGTLFLNDVDRLSPELQAQLARTLERQEVRAADGRTRPADVRVVAACARDLQELATTGQMVFALAHRLQERIVEVPSLRARRVDIPVLLHEFLRAALAPFEAVSILDNAEDRSREHDWLRPGLIARLMQYSFPGNIIELRNIAVNMATFEHTRRHAKLPALVKERMRDAGESPPTGGEDGERPGESADASNGTIKGRGRGGTSRRRPAPSDDAIRITLRKNRWNISRTARALGVSRNTLLARIEAMPDIRLARDLDRDAILDARRIHGDDMEELAAALQVSTHGLRLRCRELDLT